MGTLVALTLANGPMKHKGMILKSGSLQPAGAALTRIAEEFAALPKPLTADHSFLDDWYACKGPVPRHFLDRFRASCVAICPEDWANCLATLAGEDLCLLAQ